MKTKSKKTLPLLSASDEFKVGVNGIGWVDSDFTSRFGAEKFAAQSLGTFQKLGRSMTDAEIESELKPSLCELGDILAFIKNPPDGTKDGYANLFYTSACVVYVGWDGGVWYVRAWRRVGDGWAAVCRVFSPATDRSKSVPSSETLTLSDIEIRVKGKVYKLTEK